MRDTAASVLSSPRAIGPSRAPSWRAVLAPYAQPRLGRSLLDIATSLVPYLGLLVGMYALLDVSYWLVLAASVAAAGCLVRTYIVFHDCAHGSFLPWRKANDWLGAASGLLVFTAFQRWRHQHAVHHASSGNLDRRGVGDVLTLTVAEYVALSPHRRLGYQLVRSPVVMFVPSVFQSNDLLEQFLSFRPSFVAPFHQFFLISRPV
jgi:acyl-lipid omega-6 desaturase (Delta-12 desaturase)